MVLRLSRRFRAGPFRMNVSKHGVSWSIGGKGAWFTVGHGGVRTSLSVPGTGVGWYDPPRLSAPSIAADMRTLGSALKRALWVIAMLFVAALAIGLVATLLP